MQVAFFLAGTKHVVPLLRSAEQVNMVCDVLTREWSVEAAGLLRRAA